MRISSTLNPTGGRATCYSTFGRRRFPSYRKSWLRFHYSVFSSKCIKFNSQTVFISLNSVVEFTRSGFVPSTGHSLARFLSLGLGWNDQVSVHQKCSSVGFGSYYVARRR